MSTVSNAATTKKVAKPARDYSEIAEIRDITKEELSHYPVLAAAQDSLYWLMATFGAESQWKLLHGKGNNISSRHLTMVNPDKSSLIGRGYQYSAAIQSKYNDPLVTPQIRVNIQDGWYAHGITACMGCYHVKGTPNNVGEFRRHAEAVARISFWGLEVEPGQSITQTLFPANTKLARQKSIASGVIIFHSKYRTGLSIHRGNSALAMNFALGAYLGKQGARDANGTSPDDRRADLYSSQGRVNILQAIGLVRSGETTIASANIDLSQKSVNTGGATKVINNPSAYVATTNSSANGQPLLPSGCQFG